jgi:hypothetical protein
MAGDLDTIITTPVEVQYPFKHVEYKHSGIA